MKDEIQRSPKIPNIPKIPEIPKIPDIPKIPEIPKIPDIGEELNNKLPLFCVRESLNYINGQYCEKNTVKIGPLNITWTKNN